MARNRKRAKDRRARRPTGGVSRSPLAAAPAEAAPDPLEHAAPDVELADAQLARGRPDLLDAADAEEAEEQYELQLADGDGGGAGSGAAGAVAVPAGGRPGAAEQRISLIARLIGFLQGSWRELQRVQWPDRRQVAQATSVVIGFVIVAAVFLGLADLAFSHLMTYVLK